MPIDYKPEDAQMCFPAGDYDAVLFKVEDKTSQKGNPMQVWHFTIYAEDGREQAIKDYVTVPAGTFKIRQLAKAIGAEDAFKAGQFQADDYIGNGVRVTLIIEQQEGFDDQNKIKKYLTTSPASTPAPAQSIRQEIKDRRPATVPPIGNEEHFKEDDIPF